MRFTIFSMDSDRPLPPALLSRLRLDVASLDDSLANSSLPDSIQSGRTYADRRLLHLTPRALDTLERLSSSAASEKAQLSAASEILRRSPATRDSLDLLSSGSSLPLAALASLSSALSSMASAFSALAPASPATPTADSVRAASPDFIDVTPQPEETTFTLEDSVNSDPLPLSSLPPAPASAQMTAHGLVELKPESAAVPKPAAKPRRPSASTSAKPRRASRTATPGKSKKASS